MVHWERRLPDSGSIVGAVGETEWVPSGTCLSQDTSTVLLVFPPPLLPSTKLPCGAEMLLYKVSLEKPAVRHPRAGGLRKQLQVPGKTSAGTSYLRVCITEGLKKNQPTHPCYRWQSKLLGL